MSRILLILVLWMVAAVCVFLGPLGWLIGAACILVSLFVPIGRGPKRTIVVVRRR